MYDPRLIHLYGAPELAIDDVLKAAREMAVEEYWAEKHAGRIGDAVSRLTNRLRRPSVPPQAPVVHGPSALGDVKSMGPNPNYEAEVQNAIAKSKARRAAAPPTTHGETVPSQQTPAPAPAPTPGEAATSLAADATPAKPRYANIPPRAPKAPAPKTKMTDADREKARQTIAEKDRLAAETRRQAEAARGSADAKPTDWGRVAGYGALGAAGVGAAALGYGLASRGGREKAAYDAGVQFALALLEQEKEAGFMTQNKQASHFEMMLAYLAEETRKEAARVNLNNLVRQKANIPSQSVLKSPKTPAGTPKPADGPAKTPSTPSTSTSATPAAETPWHQDKINTGLSHGGKPIEITKGRALGYGAAALGTAAAGSVAGNMINGK